MRKVVMSVLVLVVSVVAVGCGSVVGPVEPPAVQKLNGPQPPMVPCNIC